MMEEKMSATGKVNGDCTDVDKGNLPQCSQRKPRLNRRGFHLSNHPLMNLLSDQEKSSVNGCDDGQENKIKTDSSQKRIISLSSIKNNTSEKSSSIKARESSTTINLKKSFSPIVNRNENLVSAEVSSSGDPPPKKKHKPITWP